MVFSITGWIEPKPSHTLSTQTYNWTRTWFGADIFWHDTILIIFWYKDILVNFFLNKTHWDINLFYYRCNSFRFT